MSKQDNGGTEAGMTSLAVVRHRDGLGGDFALIKGVAKRVLELDDAAVAAQRRADEQRADAGAAVDQVQRMLRAAGPRARRLRRSARSGWRARRPMPP
ncbi:hypothetical protein ABH313_01830 [Chromobacterium vaccinii]